MEFLEKKRLYFNKYLQENCKDTKVVIRSHKSKKDRQYNCQENRDKKTSDDIQNYESPEWSFEIRNYILFSNYYSEVKWCPTLTIFFINIPSLNKIFA